MATVESGSLANEPIERAGMASGEGRWALADESRTRDPGAA